MNGPISGQLSVNGRGGHQGMTLTSPWLQVTTWYWLQTDSWYKPHNPRHT